MRVLILAVALLMPTMAVASQLVYPSTGSGGSAGGVLLQSNGATMAIRPTFGGGWVIDRSGHDGNTVLLPPIGGGMAGGRWGAGEALSLGEALPVAILPDTVLDFAPLPLAGLR